MWVVSCLCKVCADRNHFGRLFYTYGPINTQFPCPVLLREETEESLADPNARVGTLRIIAESVSAYIMLTVYANIWKFTPIPNRQFMQ